MQTINNLLPGISQRALDEDPNVQALAKLFQRLEVEIQSLLEHNLENLAKEEAWGFLHAMQRRAAEQAKACIVLYSHGYHAPSEALCRTVIEATLNLYYCSLGDTCDMVLSYFKSHIDTERKQNKSWGSSLNEAAYPEDVKRVHRQQIQNKDQALDHYERIVTETFSQINRSYAKASNTWPSVFDRLKAIGKEVKYRTVYASLCSQAHNDAEDLLNDFVHSVTQVQGAHEAQAFENQNFALYMVLTALSFLIEGTAIYLAKYKLDVKEGFQGLMADSWIEIERVTKRKPPNWDKSLTESVSN